MSKREDRQRLRDYWTQKKEAYARATADGKVIVRRSGKRIQVIAPYHLGFIERAKALHGRYRYRSHMWSFDVHFRKQVLEAIKEFFNVPG